MTHHYDMHDRAFERPAPGTTPDPPMISPPTIPAIGKSTAADALRSCPDLDLYQDHRIFLCT